MLPLVPEARLLFVDRRRKTCKRLAGVDFGGAGVYGPSPSYFAACCRTAFLVGLAFGVEISACFGVALFAWGGLLTPVLLENLEEILENQEFLR